MKTKKEAEMEKKDVLIERRNPCLVCGKECKTPHPDLICQSCYKEGYILEAGKFLAQKGKILSVEEWVKTRMASRLEALHSDIAKKRAEYSSLQDEVRIEAIKTITESLGGRVIPKEILNAAIQEKRKVLWQTKKGNKLHWELKTLESQLASLQRFLGKSSPKTAATTN